ncbi:PAS domain-containing protein [Paludibacterium denitrificans]|uniref:PAS domain-containing protein n=1 Tax=Paludibacterium denitrificans TaxID=2675226 RepID=A0A844GAK8_9NEIS|nr:PAS domain-containing protein [Paludibacterium denitrificans]MTD32669.1 PAS domain-containing protein [Paludibacterium denitrificans]HJV08017.1 PAS domain-containing protein [Chromobacteriaceae bacterium]
MSTPLPYRNGNEVKLLPDELIVTKTDPTGHISYANRVFMRIAEYPEDALLGKPHNIIRHPDMPRGVYRLMWKTLQAEQEFFGIVKNYTATGNYYWVLANVTPDYGQNHKLEGYYSVRRPPSRSAIDAIIPIYEQMRQIEAKESKASAPDVSMQWLLDEMKRREISYEQFVLQLNGLTPASQGRTK